MDRPSPRHYSSTSFQGASATEPESDTHFDGRLNSSTPTSSRATIPKDSQTDSRHPKAASSHAGVTLNSDEHNEDEVGRSDDQEAMEEEEVAAYNIWNKNFLVVMVIGIALSVDTTIVLISMQAYWNFLTTSHGDLYGLAYGSYDLAQFLLTPVAGWMSDKVGLKRTMIIGMLLNVAGSLIYSLGVYVGGFHHKESAGDIDWEHLCSLPAEALDAPQKDVGTWPLLLVGRFIAGAGSSVMALGPIYITRVVSVAQRTSAIGNLRFPQTVGRMIGPTFAMFLASFLPTSIDPSSASQMLFNFYTLPSWIAAGFSFLVLLATVFCFNPDDDVARAERKSGTLEGKADSTTNLSNGGLNKNKDKHFDHELARELMFHVACQSLGFLVVSAVVVAVYSNLFALGLSYHHILKSLNDLYLLYIGVGVGVVLSIIVWKRYLVKLAIPDYMCSTYTLLLFAVGFAVMSPASSQWYFYIGLTIQSFGQPIYFPMVESFFTKTVSFFKDQTQGYTGVFISILPSAGALGRFIGPFIFSAILPVSQSSKTSEICKHLGVYPNPKKAFAGDAKEYLQGLYQSAQEKGYEPQELCFVGFPSFYMTDGCSLPHTLVVLIVCAALLVTTFVVFYLFYFKRFTQVVGVTGVEEATEEGGEARQRARKAESVEFLIL